MNPAESIDLEIEYHRRGIRSAFVRQSLGGIKAKDSSMLRESVYNLKLLGWGDDQIAQEIESTAAALLPKATNP